MEKELQKRFLSSLIIIPLSLFFIIKGSIFFTLFLCIVFLISLSEWFKMIKKIEMRILGLVFLMFSFYSAYILRDQDFYLFLLILLICILTDLGGYIFGKLFKGPKLIKISPNKTYSGMIGSFLLSIVISYYFVSKFELGVFINQSSIEEIIFLLFVLTVSSVSQIGDLIISYFKRSSKIKNTGKIFPGHGGMLDRIDGMIFVFPSIYIISILI